MSTGNSARPRSSFPSFTPHVPTRGDLRRRGNLSPQPTRFPRSKVSAHAARRPAIGQRSSVSSQDKSRPAPVSVRVGRLLHLLSNFFRLRANKPDAHLIIHCPQISHLIAQRYLAEKWYIKLPILSGHIDDPILHPPLSLFIADRLH